MARVAVVGSANVDLVVRSPRFPQPGETLLGGPFETSPGGKGANAAVAAGRLGGDVAFVGMVGADGFAELLLRSMRDAGVDLAHTLRAENTATGVALITVTDEAQNTIVIAPGANALLTADDVARSLEALKPAVTLVSLEIPIEAIEACAGARGTLILNPAPARELPDALWPRIDLFTPNEAETCFYTGIDPIDDDACLAAAAALFARGVRRVLITLGDRGCFLATPESGRPYPNLEVRALDTTAAGDAFNGALAVFLAEGRDPENAILLANCVGALTCTKRGAQEAMPSLDELREVAEGLL